MKLSIKAVALLALVFGIAAGFASARPASIGDRPTLLIAADLGVTEADLFTCFADVNPAPDHTPSGATQRANKAVLLPCLQVANPGLSNDMLDAVMDSYRPEGPMH